MTPRTFETIVTHSGSFHADEVFGAAVLQALSPDATLVRTREEAEIERAHSDAGSVVLDVGAVFAPEKHAYDHHQRSFAEVRADGTPFASFGLIWRAFGDAFLARRDPSATSEERARLSALFDETFVVPIDATDVGAVTWTSPVRGTDCVTHAVTVSGLIDAMNPSADAEPSRVDAAFQRAVTWCGPLIDDALRGLQAESDAKPIVESADDGTAVLELPEGPVPWQRWVAPHHRYVLYMSAEKDWRVQCVPQPDDPMQPIAPFPEAWRGQRDAELAATTGVPDAVFCHRALFMVGAKSREGARRLAELALVPRS